jgi:hypothetical protein
MFGSNFRTRFKRRVFWAIILVITTGCAVVFTATKKQNSSTDKEETRRVNEAADRFLRRFRETLDFETAFGEMAATNAVQRLGARKLADLLDLSRQLANEVDEGTLNRAYMASMNFIYLRAVYNFSIEYNGRIDEDHVPLPDELVSAIRGSRQLRHLLSDDVEDAPTVSTPQDLRQYIADMEHVAALYKKHLPPHVFESPTYKANIKMLGKNRGRAIEVDSGDDYFNIKEDTKVYTAQRDMFTIYFIEENGTPRILGFGMGN